MVLHHPAWLLFLGRRYGEAVEQSRRTRELDVEPISSNAAFRIRRFFTENGIPSVTVVTWAFRSQRSMMIYAAALNPAGVPSQGPPVFGRGLQDCTYTWHGIQDGALQFVKLQYYRYMLPFRLNEPQGSAR